MNQAASAHPWTSYAAALVSVGAIVAAPATTGPSGALATPGPAVHLTAADTSVGDAWTQLFANTSANIQDVFQHGAGAPAAALQQLLVNQVDHLKDVFAGDPQGALSDIGEHFKAVLAAPVNPFEPAGHLPGYLYPSVDNTPGDGETNNTFFGVPSSDSFDSFSHADLLHTLTGFAGLIHTTPANGPLGDLGSTAASLLAFTGSPLSGVLWGSIAPELSVLLQLSTDVSELGHDLTHITTDPTAVLTDLAADPANLTNALLNGYGPLDISVLDHQGLTQLLGVFGDNAISALLGSLTSADLGISIDFGGILSPGGSMFDALGIDGGAGLDYVLGTTATSITLPGEPVGALGSMIELDQAIAGALGWDPASAAMPLDSLGDLFAGL